MSQPFLSVSIVVYHPDPGVLTTTLTTLKNAIDSSGCQVGVYVIDNGAKGAVDDVRTLPLVSAALGSFDGPLHLLSGHGNVGYGQGHNLAILSSESTYHLVLNPDVELASDTLSEALQWMEAHPEFGLLAPKTAGPMGNIQYLCRRYPSVSVLFLRGFAPRSLRRWFQASLDRYEMKDSIDKDTVVNDPPIISGCFMFFRSAILKAVGGFDARYFLYFEDYDLSLRASAKARLAYVPSVKIIHYGGNAAKKGLSHVLMFVRSARLFFSSHGWRLC